MPRKQELHLSRRERQIMDIVYRRGEAMAVDVLEDLPDDPPPSKTTVRTLMRILEQKGHLEHFQQGLSYVYRPKKSRQSAGKSALQRVLRTFFGGSLEEAIAAHLSDNNTDLSEEELSGLAEIIKQAREKGR